MPRQHTITIESCGLVAIIRAAAEVDLPETSRALLRGGIKALEITLNTPGALDAIRKVRQELGERICLGAGTILSPQDARTAIEAGAEFIVTPTLQPDAIAVCQSHDVPIVCGSLTPTEMLAAYQHGADYVKLFPAASFGVEYIKAVRAPMPFLKIIPTGGVSLTNLADFFAAGCPAVACGSNLADIKLIRDGKWDELAVLAKKFADGVTKARGQRETQA